jgi:hypothetical protein
MEQELAAWEEQVEKYHQREAEAFGSYRGPVPGPGNPDGQEGGDPGDGSQGQQAGGQDGGQGESSDRSAGAYQPYQPGSSASGDEVSTAGVSESALDFLRGSQAPASQDSSEASPQENAEQLAEQNSRQSEAESQETEAESQESTAESQESAADIPLNTRGIIAIKDLDKLEGTEVPAETDDSGNP